MKNSKALAVVLAVSALVLTVACGLGDALADYPTEPVDVTNADLVGVWAGHNSSARYELRADGTFEATGVPETQLNNLANRTGLLGPFHGQGTWSIGGVLPSPKVNSEVVLDYDAVLDEQQTEVDFRSFVRLYAATPTDSPDHLLILSTTGDWLTKRPPGPPRSPSPSPSK